VWNGRSSDGAAAGVGMRERTRYLRRPRRTRWQRWAEGLDPWHPRPADYVLFVFAFLVVALAWVGVRRLFTLEERSVALRETDAALAARANALTDRAHLTERAQRELGMVVPKGGDFQAIAYLPKQRATKSRASR
jgi:hypothetical protein